MPRWPERTMTDAQRKVAAEHFELARAIGRRYARRWRGRDDDEAESEAVYTAVLCALAWKGPAPFPNYLKASVRRAVARLSARSRQLPAEAGGEALENLPARQEGPPPMPLEQLLTLAGEHAAVLRMRHLEGLSCEEIGRRLGCSRQWASELVREGMRRVVEALDGGLP